MQRSTDLIENFIRFKPTRRYDINVSSLGVESRNSKIIVQYDWVQWL